MPAVWETGKLGARIGVATTVLTVFASSPGCLNECQLLCNSWYAYLEAVCDRDVDTADLNRCVSDYRTLPRGGADDNACAYHLEAMERVEDDRLCGATWDMAGGAAFDLSSVE